MTVVFTDDFAGSGAWDPAKWTTIASGPASFTQVGGYGQIVTPAAGSYNDKLETRTKTSLSGGEYRYNFTVDDKTEYQVAFIACANGADPANWGWLPQNGYIARYTPVSNLLQLYRSDNYVLVQLGSNVTFTCVVGDVLHFAVKPGTGVFAWKNSGARPATPTIATVDTTYASGFGGIGVLGGAAATAHTLRFDNVVLDDLAAAPPPTGRVADLWNGTAVVRQRTDRWNGAALAQQAIAT